MYRKNILLGIVRAHDEEYHSGRDSGGGGILIFFILLSIREETKELWGVLMSGGGIESVSGFETCNLIDEDICTDFGPTL